MPYDVTTGKKAKSNDSQTWADFKDARQAYEKGGYDGLVFVPTKDDPFVLWDFDGCWTDMGVTAEIAPLVQELNTYTEISPSGKGLRAIANSAYGLPPNGRKNGKIEVYDSGQFLSITGHIIPNASKKIKTRTNEIKKIHEEVWGNKQPTDDKIQKILDLAFNSRSGYKIRRLFDGDYDHESQSEADLALCNHLAYYSNNDFVAIDDAFRQSKLMRNKWDEKHYSDGRTYGMATIQKAIENNRELQEERKAIQTESSDNEENGFGPEWEIITFADIQAKQTEDKPLIKDLFHEGEPILIHAKGGAGKSLIAQDIAMALACGKSSLWEIFTIPEPRASIIIQSENTLNAFNRRVKMKCDGFPDYLMGLTNVAMPYLFENVMVSGQMESRSFRQKLVDFIKRVEDQSLIKAGLMIVDPLISFHHEQENENVAMRKTLDHIQNDVALQAGVTPLVIHHDNRQGEFRGASAILDWARNMIKLKGSSYKCEKRISLIHEKCNNYENFEPFTLKVDQYLNFAPLDEFEQIPEKKQRQCEQVRDA
jgi:hypothetical protein